jgi:hypothetical protein
MIGRSAFLAGIFLLVPAAHAAPAAPYDYVKDVLIGNTVEVSNIETGKTTVYKLTADGRVSRLMAGQTIIGSWIAEAAKICATYPGENNGQPQCSDIPKEQAAVPSERDVELANPEAGKPSIKLKIKYIKGQ